MIKIREFINSSKTGLEPGMRGEADTKPYPILSCRSADRQEDQAKFPWALPKNLWPKEVSWG
jgi:hypothetical protein